MADIYTGIIRLKSSHDTIYQCNRAIFEECFEGENIQVVGIELNFISISNEIPGYYPRTELISGTEKLRDAARVTFESNEIKTQAEAEKFLLDLASAITFTWPLNRLFDHNQGSLYVAVDLKSVINIQHRGPQVSFEAMGIAEFKFNNVLPSAEPGLAHKFIYDGLQATFLEAKYFCFFSLIEMAEKSQAYKKCLSKSQLLYSSPLWTEVIELTKKISNELSVCKQERDRFTNGIGDILKTRTLLNRNEKLRIFLHSLGITSFKVYGDEERQEITTEIIKEITGVRNKMFHGIQVTDLRETLPILIAICIEFIQVLIANPKALEE